MNSIKSSITVLFLLFVSYGVYRVIHTPDPTGSANGQFLVGAQKPGQPGAADPLAVPSPALTPSPLGLSNQPANPPPLVGTGSVPPLAAPPSAAMSESAGAMPSAPSGPLNGLGAPPPTAGQATPRQLPLLPLPRLSESAAEASPPAGENALIGTTTSASAGQATIRPASNLEPSTNAGNPMLPVNSLDNLPPNTIGGPLTAVAQPNSPAAPPSGPNGVLTWDSVRTSAIEQIRQDQLTSALKNLTMLYRSDLAPDQRAELLTWLDALASRVVYSTENRLAAAPYVVQPGETLESVAAKWKVPPQLVANVNRAKLPSTGEFMAGLELKSVPGPFHCEIDSARRELTLFLGEMYAGRFAVIPPSDATLSAGRFPLGTPSRDEKTGQVLFLEIGPGLTLAGESTALPNSIVLSDSDAQDLFGILSADSQVTIIR